MHSLCDIGGNNATPVTYKEFTGNIIPNSWYKKITTASGKPDLSSIAILAEIVYWYRPSKDGTSKFKGDSWQTSYDHFEKKFGYNREAVRRIFVKLEQLKLLHREFRTIEYRGHKYNNVLFLHLNRQVLFNESLNNNGKEEDKKISSLLHKFTTPSPQNCGEHIEKEIKKENKEKYRSNESNFVLEIFKSKNSKPELRADFGTIEEIITPETKRFLGKKLLEFHPLSTSDADRLSSKSGREFNLNFINQLLLKLSSKYPKHQFPSKDAFMNYMVKALENEMHQVCRVNNTDFKMVINTHESKDFIDQINREKYLNEIENTKSTSPDDIFKRKIAGILKPEKSYKFLKSFKNFRMEDATIKFELKYLVELDEFDKRIILEQAKSVYEQNTDNKLQNIEFFIDPSSNFPTHHSVTKPKTNIRTSLPNNVWGKVREGLIERYGAGVDKSWFSCLKADIDENTKKIGLVSKSEFIRDWVQTNYYQAIEYITKKLGFEFIGLRC